jgi:multiple sugar transport system substrate-binding protein
MAQDSAQDTGRRPTLSRRQIIRGLGGLGLGAALAGCSVETSSSGGGSKTSFTVDIPDTGAKLPTAPTTIRWLNGGPGPKTFFFDDFLAAYRKKHPSITVQYDELPNNKIAEVLPLQLRNGNVADVFLVIDVPLSELVASGRLAALDDVIPNFAEWKKSFPFGTLTPGVQVFDGKTYAITPSSDRRSTLLLYNKEYLQQAGYDPGAQPLTWDDFREAAKKVTQNGAGKYYGLMLPGVFMGVVFDLAQRAGVHLADVRGDGLDWKTGEFNYHDDGVVAVVELLRALKADGSLFPGWASLKDEQARARMAQGAAGMLMSGPWNFPVWKKQNPTFEYGVSRLPAPPGASGPSVAYSVGGSNQFAVYAGASADRKAIAGDMLYYLGTESGQRAWNRLTGAADPAWSPRAMEDILGSGQLDEPNRAALKIFNETVRLAPSPLVRNPDNEKVELALVAPKPNLGQVVQGLLTGQLADPAKALRDLSTRSEQALEKAIAKARSQGANVSREDWRFPNWDPTKDYVDADYKQL